MKNRDKLWEQCRVTIYVIVSMVVTGVLWMVGYGGYEVYTLQNGLDNDTISHAVGLLWELFPWLDEAFWAFLAVWTVFWVVVGCHWFVKGFFWTTKYIEEDGNDD